eukprot:768523-Hanusia_phi.AAC.3
MGRRNAWRRERGLWKTAAPTKMERTWESVSETETETERGRGRGREHVNHKLVVAQPHTLALTLFRFPVREIAVAEANFARLM